VPVPRRFDRRPPDRDQTRINDRIRVSEVRLVGEDGKQIGVISTSEALAYAQERDLDLVEVAPDARPPVCRVLDYSKFKYEQAQKAKQARKHQQQITIREIKFRPKIAQNDYDTKKGHVTRFLRGKDRVKVTIMFRGREVTHPERGSALLEKLADELSEIAVVEQRPIQDGRNMTMMLGPSKTVLADGHVEGDADASASARASSGDAEPSGRADAPRNGDAPTSSNGPPARDGDAARNGEVTATDEATAPADDATAPADRATAPADAATAATDEATAPADEATAANGDAAATSDDDVPDAQAPKAPASAKAPKAPAAPKAPKAPATAKAPKAPAAAKSA
jgi:translation initiation factor IF-3